MRKLVPAETLERSAAQQYQQMLDQARAQRALAPPEHPQLQRLHAIAKRLIPFTAPWNERAGQWRWEVNLIGSQQINAFCMPGGKIAFYTGILDQLKLTDDEAAMIMGHEMAHALREHARERIAKTQGTNLALRLGSQLLGLGDLGNVAASLGGQLLTLQFSRSDESDADESFYTRLDENTYLFEGKTHIGDFERVMELDEETLSDVRGDAETLAGLILELKRDFPKQGESVVARNLRFVAEKIEGHRIDKVKVIVNG